MSDSVLAAKKKALFSRGLLSDIGLFQCKALCCRINQKKN